MGARLLFNAIVHQYGVPGLQVGAKVPVSSSGEVGDVFCVSRRVTPGQGCLWCNGLINASRLQDEAISDETRRGYAYVADPHVVAPSVITLNAIACAHAADEFLTAGYDRPRRDLTCLECSPADESRLGRGDIFPLPTRMT